MHGSEVVSNMPILLRLLRWVWVVLVLASVLGLAIEFAADYFQTGSLSISPQVSSWLKTNYLWIVAGLSSLALLTLAAWLLTRQEESHKSLQNLTSHFLVLKPVKDLDPERDLNISQYRLFYMPRRALDADSGLKVIEAEPTIASLIEQQYSLVIVGKPKQGKTRLAYQVLNDYGSHYLLKPLPENLKIEALDFAALRHQTVILMLDDLNRYIDRFDPESLKHRIEEGGCRCCLVATCRDGSELEAVKSRMAPLYARLRKIYLMELEPEEGERLASELGIQWRSTDFDGTPGSILLDLHDMSLRYERLEPYQKGVMKALKLLYSAGVFTYWHDRLKEIVMSIFEFAPVPRHEWERHLRALASEGLLTRYEDPVEVENAYLENIIVDYPSPQTDFPA